eukprot:jgi/Tetstr1/434863/TSEL_002577.t1
MARISSNSEDQGCPDACPVARSNTCGPALDTSAARTRKDGRQHQVAVVAHHLGYSSVFWCDVVACSLTSLGEVL